MNLDGVSLLIGAAIGAALFAAYQRNQQQQNMLTYNAQFGDKTYSGNIRFPQIGAQNQ